jgi:membrane protease YdiL (CAAX protease family)
LAELPSIPPSAWVVPALLFCIALYVYGLVVQRIVREGGRVDSEGFELPELLMTFVIGAFFLLNAVAAFLHLGKPEEKEITIDKVLPGSLLYVIISVGLICFLHFARRIHVSRIFGFFRVPVLEMIGWIAGLLLAAFPVVGAVNLLTQSVMKNDFAPQPLVKLFTEVVRQDNHSAVATIFLVGTIVAPCCEEFLFRGFFYRTWKRYLGPLGAGFVASVLFAALHGSVPALAGLFVLACFLTVAYERTGTLLVPIGMHAAFNFTSLSVLYIQARFLPIPVPT